MLNNDVQMLDPQERGLLDQSFQVYVQSRRVRGVAWSTVAIFAGLVLLWGTGLTRSFFVLIAATILGISLVEKLTYHREMRRYESIIRKLVRRVEQLEGVQLSVDESIPTRNVRDLPRPKLEDALSA